MKFSAAAVLATAAGVSAWNNVTYTTEVVTAVTTYCPAATEITHGGQTYTVTEATTLTITNCPCTVTRPVTTSSYANTTAPAPTKPGHSAAPTKSTTPVTTAGAGKAAALSGGALAGVLGLAAFVL
jgi:hypothetical protein